MLRSQGVPGWTCSGAGWRKKLPENEEDGQKARMEREEGQCVMYLRLPAKEKEAQEETEKVLKGNRFAILAAESEQVFRRRV